MNKEIKFKKNLIFKRILFLIMLFFMFYIIFKFSAQNGEHSGSLSRKVSTYLIEVLSKIKTMDYNLKLHYIIRLEPIIRKLAHFTLYALVGFSVMGFFCTFDIKNKYKLLWSCVIGVTYAITDEWHQSFTPGRSARLLDVGIDSLGVITGIFIMILLIILFESIVNWLKK